MLTALLLAGLLAGGSHPLVVAAVGLAIVRPGWFLVLAALWAAYAHWRSARGPSFPLGALGGEAAFLQGMASELAAGGSLRSSLEAAAQRAPKLPLGPAVRLAKAGRPMEEVAQALQPALSHDGRITCAALRVAALTGGRAATIFGRLALRAFEGDELVRERRALTAQARLSAWLIGGAGPLGLVVLVLSGRADVLLNGGGVGAAVLVVGALLQIAGSATVWWMLRRAER
ncbi:MAG: hypothetical protein M3N51_05545 [Actinomycetota bacterium]|nr:hypothetical protein [Actinomycetota bacterium]